MHHPVQPQMMGPTGPYHHSMPPMSQQFPYHDQQIPTTSHPSWHQGQYPASPYQQMHPGGPQTVNYPLPSQQLPTQQMMYHSDQQLQHSQPQPQQQQRPPSYSSPSPSRGPPAPQQNQQFRTQEWINNTTWPYTQSPAPLVVPSMMSYHQGPNDDRMSMLSVNTQMTTPYQDRVSQRCYSSNGSTCENVNPEMMQVNLTQIAKEAMEAWFKNPDPAQRLRMAQAIRAWVKQEKFRNIDPRELPMYIQQILKIVHDGLRSIQSQIPQVYIGDFCSIYTNLLDILLRLTMLTVNTQHFQMIIKMFTSQTDFRDLFCNFLHISTRTEPRMEFCTIIAFQLIGQLIKSAKQDDIRAELARSLKFERFVGTMLSYFDEKVPVEFMNIAVFAILRFLISKDAVLKNSFIWQNRNEKVPPQNSLVVILCKYVFRVQQTLQAGITPQNPALSQMLIKSIVCTFDLLELLLHDSDAIDGFVNLQGVAAVCNVLQMYHPDVSREGFKLLLHVSDARALANVDLNRNLPFLINFIYESKDEDVVNSGTGFLSNVVAHKQHVKELAISNNAIFVLHEIICRLPKITDVMEYQRRNRVCEIISNSLRTLNNFLRVWTPMLNGENRQVAGEIERQQVTKFTEVDVVKKLMNCLSSEGIETPALLELRSTIIRSIHLLLRTPFISKQGLLAVIDDVRKENLVGHICAAYVWATQQTTTTVQRGKTKKLLIERAVNVLLLLIEQCGAEKEVAECSYAMECLLKLLEGNQAEQMETPLLLNLLKICDTIFKHSTSRNDNWTVDRAILEKLALHENPQIAQAANSVLSKLSDNYPLAGIFANHSYE